MDIRGFQSAINNDVQMQHYKKGAAANHGKATLGVFNILLPKLSKGRMALYVSKDLN